MTDLNGTCKETSYSSKCFVPHYVDSAQSSVMSHVDLSAKKAAKKRKLADEDSIEVLKFQDVTVIPAGGTCTLAVCMTNIGVRSGLILSFDDGQNSKRSYICGEELRSTSEELHAFKAQDLPGKCVHYHSCISLLMLRATKGLSLHAASKP